jgi:hypothetical protein
MSSKKFLVNLDLTKNELQNAVIQNLGTAPSSPKDGQIYYNTSDDTLYFYNGTTWVNFVQTTQVTFNTFSNRPAANTVPAGTLFFATDTNLLYLSDATTWDQISSFGSVSAQTSYGDTSSNGTSNDYARADHTHGTPSLTSTAPQTLAAGGTNSVGTATTPARADHVHALPNFGNVSAQTTFGASSANGTGTEFARNDHTHGTPVHDNAAHSAINLSALTVPTADVSFATYKITNLGTPTADTDAATKAYVDATSQGLAIKEAVHSATAAILPNSPTWTSANGGTITAGSNTTLTVDGDQVLSGQRVLVKNEASVGGLGGQYNGIYTLTVEGDGSTAWVLVRSADANTSAEVKSGMFTFVQTGDTLANTGWVLTTDNPITLNTTVLEFTQFSGAGTYTASNGVALGAVGGANNFSAVAGTGITVDSGGININTAVVVTKFAANVGNGSAQSITVTHNLGTKDVIVSIYDNSSPYAEVICDVEHTSTTAITLNFTVAPTSNQYRVVVHA